MIGKHEGSASRIPRVLVAEGESPAAEALATALRRNCVEVDLAATATEAVVLLSQSFYSVAVIDLALLAARAGEVVAQLASVPRDERPIVLGTTDGGPRVEFDADVVQVVIRKPFRPGELADVIRACIDQESIRRGTSIEARRPRLDLHRD